MATEQSIEFLSLTQHHELFPLFALAINTGMRQGELLGLRWKDINFIDQTAMIRQTKEHDCKNIKAGVKTISIGFPTSVIPILIEHKRQQESNLDILGLSNDLDLVYITGTNQCVLEMSLNAFKMQLSIRIYESSEFMI